MALGVRPGGCVSSHSVSLPARTADLPVSTEHGRWSLKEMSCWYSFPRAVTTNYNKLDGFKRGHLFSPSQSWRLEVQNQGSSRATLILQAPGRVLPPLLASGGSRRFTALLPSLPPLSHGSYLCVCVPSSRFL